MELIVREGESSHQFQTHLNEKVAVSDVWKTIFYSFIRGGKRLKSWILELSFWNKVLLTNISNFILWNFWFSEIWPPTGPIENFIYYVIKSKCEFFNFGGCTLTYYDLWWRIWLQWTCCSHVRAKKYNFCRIAKKLKLNGAHLKTASLIEWIFQHMSQNLRAQLWMYNNSEN